MSYIYIVLLAAISALLPWGKSINGTSIAILVIFWLFTPNWKEKWGNIKKYYMYILPMLLFFITHLIGLIYTSNINIGLEEIGRKLSFFLLPIIVFSIFPKIEPYIHYIKKTFVVSLCIYFITSLISAYFNYKSGNNIAFFYIHLISFSKMHPSYVSMYLLLGIVFLYEFAQDYSIKYYSIIPFFIFFIILLSARTELIILLFLLIALCLFHFITTKKWNIALIGVSIIVLTSILSVLYIPELNTRFSVLIKGEEKPLSYKDLNNERKAMWFDAIDQIQNTPILGIGTGSSTDFYKQKGLLYNDSYLLIKKINNAHNQYLQQMLTLGVLGIISLLYLYIYMISISIKKLNPITFLFSMVLILASFTECILETQSGIVFICLFYSLLISKKYKKDSTHYINQNPI